MPELTDQSGFFGQRDESFWENQAPFPDVTSGSMPRYPTDGLTTNLIW